MSEPTAPPTIRRGARWVAPRGRLAGWHATIVNVALPTIMDELDLTLTQAESGVNSTYALVFASLLILLAASAMRSGASGCLPPPGSSCSSARAPGGARAIEVIAAVTGRARRPGVGGAAVSPTSSLSLVNATFRGSAHPQLRRLGSDDPVGWPRSAGGALAEFRRLALDFPREPAAQSAIVGSGGRSTCRSPSGRCRRPTAELGTCRVSLGLALLRLIEGQTYGWLRPRYQTFVVGAWEWPLSASHPCTLRVPTSRRSCSGCSC